MESIKTTVAKAIGQRQASTKRAPINIATWEKWAEFETLGDPQLRAMLTAFANFILDVEERQPTPWLVLLGTSGAGKTHLAKRAFRWWKRRGGYVEGKAGNSYFMDGQLCNWARWIKSALETQDYSRAADLSRDRFVVLDDVGAGAEAKGWIADSLYTIIESRLSPRRDPNTDEPPMMATIITANLSLEQIANQYDLRIASRLVRLGKDKVVTVKVPDFKMRS